MNSKYRCRDWLTAIALCLTVGVLSVMILNSGHHWGDDYAAYLNEAFAISEGRLDLQDKLNVFMHPSTLTFLPEDADSLSYVWGYPLLLSVLHRFVGFDQWDYSSLIYYKLPAAVSVALLAAVLFLFYRRRFSYLPSLLLSLLFCLCSRFFPEVNSISPELPFLLFFVLSFWLIELVLDEPRLGSRIMKLLLLGIALWAAYVTRLNGFSAVLMVLLAHFIGLVCNRRWRLSLLWDTLPYLICFGLLFISYHFLPVPTSNLSDIGDVSFRTILENCVYYFNLICDWLVSLFSRRESGLLHYDGIGPVLFVLMIVGVWKYGLRRNLHLTVLILCTIIAVLGLNYQQGLRYLYGILPFVLLFAAHGVTWLYRHLLDHSDPFLQSFSRRFVRVLSVFILFVVLLQNGTYAYQCFHTRGEALADENAYSTYAVDIYRYIQNETPEDSVFAYYKPRGLYLNTNRIAFKSQIAPELVHNHDAFFPYQTRYTPLETADYVLLYDDFNDEELKRIQIELADRATLELVYENKMFELYELKK